MAFLIDTFKHGSSTDVEHTETRTDRASADAYVQDFLQNPANAGKGIVLLEEPDDPDQPAVSLWDGIAGVHQYAHP